MAEILIETIMQQQRQRQQKYIRLEDGFIFQNKPSWFFDEDHPEKPGEQVDDEYLSSEGIYPILDSPEKENNIEYIKSPFEEWERNEDHVSVVYRSIIDDSIDDVTTMFHDVTENDPSEWEKVGQHQIRKTFTVNRKKTRNLSIIKKDLYRTLAELRWKKEVFSVLEYKGKDGTIYSIDTSRESQNKLTMTMLMATTTEESTIIHKWKMKDGVFYEIDSETLKGIYSTLFEFISSLYSKEMGFVEMIKKEKKIGRLKEIYSSMLETFKE